MAELFVNSLAGKRLKEQWEQAQCDKDIHDCLNSMVPALLLLLHDREQGTSRPTYYGTCGGAPSEHAYLCRSAKLVCCSTPHDRIGC